MLCDDVAGTSGMFNLRMDPARHTEMERSDLEQLAFCAEMAVQPMRNGGVFVIERPLIASRWMAEVLQRRSSRPEAEFTEADPRAFGLWLKGRLAKKPTKLSSRSRIRLDHLSRRCPRRP